MLTFAIASVFAAATAVAAQQRDEDGRYTISAPGIKAQVKPIAPGMQAETLTGHQFIPYGATLTNLFVKDKNGEDVDVVLGYDDVDFYRKNSSGHGQILLPNNPPFSY